MRLCLTKLRYTVRSLKISYETLSLFKKGILLLSKKYLITFDFLVNKQVEYFQLN